MCPRLLLMLVLLSLLLPWLLVLFHICLLCPRGNPVDSTFVALPNTRSFLPTDEGGVGVRNRLLGPMLSFALIL